VIRRWFSERVGGSRLHAREVTYTVPDYFAGQLNIMAVAVAPDAIGEAETKSVVRGPMVLTPNVPVFAAPGDEFTASLAVANNLEGPDAAGVVALTLSSTANLELMGDGTQNLKWPPRMKPRRVSACG